MASFYLRAADIADNYLFFARINLTAPSSEEEV